MCQSGVVHVRVEQYMSEWSSTCQSGTVHVRVEQYMSDAFVLILHVFRNLLHCSRIIYI
jgi:hypothetical protein